VHKFIIPVIALLLGVVFAGKLRALPLISSLPAL